MTVFVSMILLGIFMSGLFGFLYDNEGYIGLQFVIMLFMVVAVPIVAIFL